jgi:tetratricopeptide (TPR) repeat protein
MRLWNERASATPSSRPKPRASEPPLGAAAQILAQAEAAYQAGHATEAIRHLKLLSAMTFDDARIQERATELKRQVYRTAAVDLEKQATHEEKLQQWDKAANTWLRVAEGRPQDSLPWQRAALAQLHAGVELRAAVENAKRAVQLAPNDAQAHRTLAKVYSAADMQASAARELEAARRCEPASEADDDATPTGLFKRLLGRDGGS